MIDAMSKTTTERRTCRYRVGEARLMEALGFPAGGRIRVVTASNDPVEIDLVFEHSDLQPVEPGMESPYRLLLHEVELDDQGRERVLSSRWV